LNAERWRQIDKICSDALRQPPAGRAAFLDEACAEDPSLRQEVEAVLGAVNCDDSFLNSPAIEALANAFESSKPGSFADRTFGPYKTTMLLGAGGMGEVYLADDVKHRRKVAIKVFDSQLAAVVDSDRFLREIELTAGLTHPHILPLHDSGVANGVLYYVMPYIQGESLRDCLARQRRLPVEDAMRIARGLADALAFAHRKGIVHRDIKPGNILLQNGHALLADFGIARNVSLANDSPLTQTGIVVGTPRYMSPEQAAGDAAVDARSDIYSLACVLFETLTGSPPFAGSTTDAVTRRLTEAAPRARTIAPEIPSAIDDALAKALARDPKQRFATADEFAAALTAPQPTPRSSAKGVVVLPFSNLSPDPENEFFADGLTEEVIADLSGVRALRVISRTSAIRFKGTNKDVRAIARELDVRYAVEGSVRRAGASLRVTAQLIDAETDSHLWAEKYSGSVQDVFAIQEEISRKIVNALQVKLTESESRGNVARPIDNASAYDYYIRARHEVYTFTAVGLERAKKLVEAGLALVGENPMLLATRGMVSWYYLNFSFDPDERHLDEAATYARRSLDQDPQNYFAIFLRGLVAFKRGELEIALRDLQKAYELKPSDAMVLAELNHFLWDTGKWQTERARAIFDEYLKIDPLTPISWQQCVVPLIRNGRPVEAVAAARRVLDLTEVGNPVRVYVGHDFALLNMRDEAARIFEEEGAALGPTPYGSAALFLRCALKQDAEGAAENVTPQLQRAAFWTENLAIWLADGFALLDHRDEAMHWLRKAVDRGFINYAYLAKLDPMLESLRADAEFKELIQQVQQRSQALEF
jgi:serine/threonine protein kinase